MLWLRKIQRLITFARKAIVCRERNKTFKNGKRYDDKDSHLAIGGGQSWVKWLKTGVGLGFVSHAVSPALHPFWWKIHLYTLIFSMLESCSWKNNIVTENVKGEKMVVFAKTFDNHHRRLNFGHFFNSPLKREKDLNQTFWLTSCHGFT